MPINAKFLLNELYLSLIFFNTYNKYNVDKATKNKTSMIKYLIVILLFLK